MATVANTWSGSLDDGDPADGGVVETALDALRAGINSIDASQIASGANIDGADLLDGSIANAKLTDATIADGKLNWSSVTAVRAAAAARKMIVGTKSVTVANGTDEKTEAVDFTTDGQDTPTDFSSTTGLIVVATVVGTQTDTEELMVDVNTIATTGFNAVVRTCSSGNTTADRTVTVHWMAFGRA